MNQAPNGTGRSNGVSPPTEALLLLPIESSALRYLLSRSNNFSPLGQYVNRYSALTQAQDPVKWHLVYWLHLSVVASLRGEDSTLMALRIEMEQRKIADRKIKTAVLNTWTGYQMDNKILCERVWRQRTLDSGEARYFLRDLDKMLEYKVAKAFHYLRRIERQMVHSVRNGNFADVQKARGLFEKLAKLYRKLLEEHEANVANQPTPDAEIDEFMSDEDEQEDDEEEEDEVDTDSAEIRIPGVVDTSDEEM